MTHQVLIKKRNIDMFDDYKIKRKNKKVKSNTIQNNHLNG